MVWSIVMPAQVRDTLWKPWLDGSSTYPLRRKPLPPSYLHPMKVHGDFFSSTFAQCRMVTYLKKSNHLWLASPPSFSPHIYLPGWPNWVLSWMNASGIPYMVVLWSVSQMRLAQSQPGMRHWSDLHSAILGSRMVVKDCRSLSAALKQARHVQPWVEAVYRYWKSILS